MINLHIFQLGRSQKDPVGYYEIPELLIFPDINQWLFNIPTERAKTVQNQKSFYKQ